MQTLKNTLTAEWDRWSDPGDYPNGVAGGPLRSYKYITDLSGEVQIELTDEELADLRQLDEEDDEALETWVGENVDIPEGFLRIRWSVKLDRIVLIRPKSVDPDPDYEP